MLDPDDLSPEDNLPQTVRSVFLIDNKKKLRMELVYPSSTGRNWKEVLRAIDSILLADKHPIGTVAIPLRCSRTLR
jgi:alkyl hydroperoxide reductase subunit AhpC